MDLPQSQPLEISVFGNRVEACFALARAGHVTAVKEQLAGNLHWMCFKKAGVVRRVEKVPGRRPVMRYDLGYDGIAERSFIRFVSQSDMNIVVGAAKEIALHALAIAFR